MKPLKIGLVTVFLSGFLFSSFLFAGTATHQLSLSLRTHAPETSIAAPGPPTAAGDGFTYKMTKGGSYLIGAVTKLCKAGLSALRFGVIFFLLFYGLYLGVSLSLGQSQPEEVQSYVIGSIFALGANYIAGIFAQVFGETMTKLF